MSNIDSIIAEVVDDLSNYSDAGLIDENKLYNDAVKALKRFGNDVTVLQEAIIDVKGGVAELPRQFFSLYFAYLCEPLAYTTEDVEFDDLQSSYFYRERVAMNSNWSNCESCCENQEENVIRESVYFKRGKANFYYHRPQLLRLGKSLKKSSCHSKCRNKYTTDNPNEIVIIENMLQANFNEGTIYMQYYGLPVDDEGNIDIPETKNGNLETYIEYYLKRKTAERLMGNNDAAGLQNLYGIYKGEENNAVRLASAELKLTKLTPRALQRWVRLNKLEALSFEITAPRWL